MKYKKDKFSYKVNILHRGKERWNYCRTIQRAKFLQQSAKDGGLSSIILERVPERWRVYENG